jgi:hypothetical protein
MAIRLYDDLIKDEELFEPVIPKRDLVAEKRVSDANKEFLVQDYCPLLKEVALKLKEQSVGIRDHSSEKLLPIFADNDAYKVNYRFIANMTQQWKTLGLEHFPTEKEAIKIARFADPFFIWLFKDNFELLGFESTYAFHEDIWCNE